MLGSFSLVMVGSTVVKPESLSLLAVCYCMLASLHTFSR